MFQIRLYRALLTRGSGCLQLFWRQRFHDLSFALYL